MQHPRRQFARSLRRLVRSRVFCALILALMVPTLAAGAFGGTTFVVHAHDGHGLHVHLASSEEYARVLAEQHRLSHALGISDCESNRAPAPTRMCGVACETHPTAPCGDEPHPPTPAEGSDGLVISFPHHEQAASRSVALPPAGKSTPCMACFITDAWQPPAGEWAVGSPGGRDRGDPRHLATSSGAERLIRTSRALLI